MAPVTARSLALLALVAAGCVPSRDNPHDPVRAPTASLRVRDLTSTAGGCDTSTVGEEVIAAPRTRCLALDASLSDDPQGRPLRHDFRLLESLANAEEDLDGVDASDAPVLVLGTDFGGAHRVGVPLTFRVTVWDADGGSASADTTLVLSNRPPTAIVQPPFSLPLGGFPWSPGASFAVDFRGTGSDPEGDRLTYCWTFVVNGVSEAPICSASATDPLFTRTLPAGVPQLVVGRFTVTDAPTTEAVAPDAFATVPLVQEARVSDTLLWASPVPQGGFIQVDTVHSFPSRPAFCDKSPLASYLPATEMVGVVDCGYLNSVSLDVSSLESFEGDDDGYGGGASMDRGRGWQVAADAARDRFWVLYDCLSPTACEPSSGGVFDTCGDEGPSRVIAYEYSGALGLVDVACASSPIAMPGHDAGALAVDGAGNGWAAATAGSALQIVFADGNGSLAVAETGTFGDLAPRPDSDEMWVFRAGGNGTIVRALRLVGGEIEETERVELDELIQEVAWIGSAAFWAAGPDSGLALVDADLLVATESLSAATLLSFPLFGIRSLVVDPVSGNCWAESPGEGAGHVVTTDGRVRSFPAGPFEPRFVDSRGALWFVEDLPGPGGGGLSDGRLAYGLGLSNRARFRALPFAASGVEGELEPGYPHFEMGAPAGIDWERGGLWLVADPPALIRAAEDGTALRVEGTVQTDGVVSPVPRILSLRTAPAPDSRAWAITEEPDKTRSVDLLDLSTSPPTRSRVLDDSHFLALDQAGLLLEPAVGSTSWAWTASADGPGVLSRIQLLEPDGTLTTKLTFPSNEAQGTGVGYEVDIAAARSLQSNRLCVATVRHAGPARSLVVRWLDPSAPAGVVDSELVVPVGDLKVADVSVSVEGERCWIVGNVGDFTNARPHFFVVDAAGALVFDVFGVGIPDQQIDDAFQNEAFVFARSISAVGADHAWVVLELASEEVRRVRLRGYNSLEDEWGHVDIMEPDVETRFVAP